MAKNNNNYNKIKPTQKQNSNCNRKTTTQRFKLQYVKKLKQIHDKKKLLIECRREKNLKEQAESEREEIWPAREEQEVLEQKFHVSRKKLK